MRYGLHVGRVSYFIKKKIVKTEILCVSNICSLILKEKNKKEK